jgi:hypothetical protein
VTSTHLLVSLTWVHGRHRGTFVQLPPSLTSAELFVEYQTLVSNCIHLGGQGDGTGNRSTSHYHCVKESGIKFSKTNDAGDPSTTSRSQLVCPGSSDGASAMAYWVRRINARCAASRRWNQTFPGTVPPADPQSLLRQIGSAPNENTLAG